MLFFTVNRTLMELKLIIKLGRGCPRPPVNRTLMELKCDNVSESDEIPCLLIVP